MRASALLLIAYLSFAANANSSLLILTKNATRILDGLFIGYTKTLRPGVGGDPVVIAVDLLVRSMGPISEKDMEYSIDCYFRQSWKDSRLAYDAPNPALEKLSLNMRMLEEMWKPDTFFYNGRHSYLHTITYPNRLLRISSDGTVYYSQRLTVKARCNMDLRNFPMDKQSCPLILGSYGYGKKDLIYVWSKAPRLTPGLTLSQFEVTKVTFGNLSHDIRDEYLACFDPGRLNGLSIIDMSVHLKRRMGYFLSQMYIPCALLVALSWVAFWINREATSDRIGLGVTTVLTIAFFALDSREGLAKVSYSTALDQYVLLCYAFLLVSIIEFATVHYFTKIGSGSGYLADGEDSDSELDRKLTESLASVETSKITLNKNGNSGYMGLFHPDLIYKPFVKRETCCTRFINCIKGSYSYRYFRKKGSFGALNSVSVVDRSSRIVFPALFILLNIIYWDFYLE